MAVTVMLFGPLAIAAGKRTILLEGGTCAELRLSMAREHPVSASLLKSARFAVNQAFVEEGHAVKSSDEVALIPPVSGGAW